MKPLRTCVLLLCLTLLGAALPATPAVSAASSETGTFYPLTSGRLLDTRNGTGGPAAPLGPGGTLTLQVAGRNGVPTTGVAAVVLNVTATGGTATGYLTAYATGQTRPSVSTNNYVRHTTRANGATVGLGTGGKISIYNSAGSVNVIVDVLGYYASSAITTTSGTEFYTYGPDRLTDTRNSSEGKLAAKDTMNVYVDFDGGAANRYVKAFAVNVTAVNGTADNGTGSGHISLFDGDASKPPTTSTLNFTGPGAVANMAVVKTSLCTECEAPSPVRFAVYNGSSQGVHVIVDLVGIYYNDGTVGLRFHPLTPTRMSDSRKSLNGTPLGAAQTQTLTAPTRVAGTNTVALVSNVTAIAPTAQTYFTIWANGDAKPGVSNLNASTGAVVANTATIPLSTERKFNLFNSAGKTNFTIDVTGRFDVGASTAMRTPASQSRRFGGLTTSSQRSVQRSR